MTKLVLNDLESLTNEQSALSTMAANNAATKTALENTLSRDGTSPNQMAANFDMNSFEILNLPEATDPTSPVRLQEIGNAHLYATEAIASAAAALTSQTAAATSATNSASSATASASSASAASTSASTATTQASAASTSATSASTSASTATTQATNAATSASAASTSATAAASSATAAASSASAASTSATTASTQASNASTSATNAATSATNASNSAATAVATIGDVYTWSTATTNSDPGTGGLKVNNATVSSATALYISETDAQSNNLAAYIVTWGTSTSSNKSTLTISKTSAPNTVWASFYITSSVTDNGTWDAFTISYLAGAGSFSNGDSVSVKADRTGDAGSGSVAGMTIHGIPIAGSSTAISSSVVLGDGQVLIGQTSADPLAKTLTGDVTIVDTGATTVAKIAGVTVTGTTGTVNNVFSNSPTLVTPTLGVASATSINKLAITAPATGSTLTVADGKTVTVNNTLTFAGTDTSTLTIGSGGTLTGSSATAIWYDNIPQNSKSAAYTTVIADAEKHILHPSADTTARTFTIDSNANVAYPIGTAITFVNQNSGGVVTIAITSDTMRLAGAGTTGSRTLAANGIATALKITSTEWIISGTGLT